MSFNFDKYKIAFNNLPRGVSEAEINLEAKEGMLIGIEKGKIIKSISYNKNELHLRASAEKTGYTYTEQLNEEPIHLINRAVENSKIIENARLEKINTPYELNIDKENTSTMKEASLSERMTNAAVELEELLFSCDNRIKKHAGCSISADFRNSYVMNSLGLNIAFSNNFFRSEVTAIIEENGEQYDYSTFSMAPTLDGLKLKEVAKKAANMAAIKIGAVQPASGIYNLLISNEVVQKMMITIWQMFSAPNIVSGKSILKDMLNKKIGSHKLNIADSPSHPLSGYSFEFDSEGTKAKDKLLVRNGRLENVLSNNTLAADMGTNSSGNAGWYDTMGNIYPSQLTVTPMNIYICPGDKSEGKLMNELKDGIYIAYVGDYYHSIDITSGDISMPCGGAIIKAGKLSEHIKQMTLSCNIVDLFNNIAEVGNDLLFDEFNKRSYCMGSPCLLVKNMYISSK